MDRVSQEDIKRLFEDTGIARVNLDAVWKELHQSYVSKTYIKEKAKTIIKCCEFMVMVCNE